MVSLVRHRGGPTNHYFVPRPKGILNLDVYIRECSTNPLNEGHEIRGTTHLDVVPLGPYRWHPRPVAREPSQLSLGSTLRQTTGASIERFLWPTWDASSFYLLCRRSSSRRGLLSFHRVDHYGSLSALRGRGKDRVQIDAFGGQLLQALSQCTGLVGQLNLLSCRLVVRDPGIVQSFLGSSRVLNYELKCPARPLGRCQQGENVDLCIPQGLCDLGHRTGSVFNPDCELLCLGHSETS